MMHLKQGIIEIWVARRSRKDLEHEAQLYEKMGDKEWKKKHQVKLLGEQWIKEQQFKQERKRHKDGGLREESKPTKKSQECNDRSAQAFGSKRARNPNNK